MRDVVIQARGSLPDTPVARQIGQQPTREEVQRLVWEAVARRWPAHEWKINVRLDDGE